MLSSFTDSDSLNPNLQVAGNKITVHFNSSLLYSEKVVVQDPRHLPCCAATP